MANGLHEHTFGLLASAELGAWPNWTPPPEQLRPRIETLALCMGVVPRLEAGQLESILQGWQERFPDNQRVAATDLRTPALAVLRQGSVTASGPEFEKALALVRMPPGDEATESVFDTVRERAFSDAEAQRQCARGLGLWFQQVANDRRWRYLPAIVPGEAAAEIESVYVELYAVSAEDGPQAWSAELASARRPSQRLLATQYPVVSVPSLVSRTLRQCIVMGEP